MVKKLLIEKTLISDQPEKFAENSAKSCPKYIPMPPERKRNEDISKASRKFKTAMLALRIVVTKSGWIG